MKESKGTVDDLAIFGGPPAFDETLHVGRPNIGNRNLFQEKVNDILDRRWLTNSGRYVDEFERRIARFAGVNHCVAMCNGTVALEIAIRALGMTGEVILPSFTFIATAHALQWQEITPVFCDIDPLTHTVDPSKLESLITPRTTGIIGVHTYGKPCDIDALSEIARRRGLKLLFDSAGAFGCSYQGRMIGGFGDAEVYSFHATKIVNSLEGGAVLTNDADLARKMRLMKNFGFTYYDRTDNIGTNGKMNEISAAMGLTNLESLDDFTAVSRRNLATYAEELTGLGGITLLAFDEDEKCNFHYVVLELDEDKIVLSRDQLVDILHAEHVLARRHFSPGCHRMEPYRSLYPNAHLVLPQTERMAARVMTLPTGQVITPDIIARVCDIIRFALENAEEIHKRLQARPAPR